MLSADRVSTGMAAAVPPAPVISRATVVMVESTEFGSGGNGCVSSLSFDTVFEDTTTADHDQAGGRHSVSSRSKVRKRFALRQLAKLFTYSYLYIRIYRSFVMVRNLKLQMIA